MFSRNRPWARARRALAFVPLLAALASAHPASPGGHPKPVPQRECLETSGLDFGSVAVGTKARLSLQVSNRCPRGFSIWKVTSGSRSFAASLPRPVNVPPRGSAPIPVSFSPADTGLKKSTLILYTQRPIDKISARVAGRGIAPPAPPPPVASITVSPASVRLDKGPAETDTFTLSVTNHGTSPRAEILVDAVGAAQPRPERGWRILYLNTYVNGPWEDELTRMLEPMPGIDTVAPWYGGDSLPSLSRMLEYDAVMVVSVHPWKDSVAAGNVLADYLEAGGKVLLTSSCLSGGRANNSSLSGRILDYAPIGKTDWTYTRPVASLVPHPITQGVAGFQSAGILNVTATNGQGAGIPLGTYQDGILVGAYHPDKPLVFLNIDYAGFSGDIPRLLANTFDYLGGMLAWMTPRPPFNPVIFVVPDGETRELKVAVNTHRLAAGNHAGAIRLLNASDTDAVPLDVPVALTVSSRRKLAVDPAAYDFGPTWQGSRATHQVRLVNTGNAAARVTEFASNGAAFSLSALLPLEIPAFSSVLVPASFAPAALGPDSAFVEARGDAQEPAAPGIALKGKGIVPPILSVSPQGFDATIAQGQATGKTLVIRNPGDDSLRIRLRAEVDSAAGIHPTGPEKLKVLYLQTTGQSFESPTDFFLWYVASEPRVDTLVNFSGADSTPTVDYLRQFDAVIAVGAGAWADSETVGNRLAEYVDAGGKVILMGAALFTNPGFNEHSPALGGRITTADYSPVAPSSLGAAQAFLDHDPDHFLLDGIGFDFYSDWVMNVFGPQGAGSSIGVYANGAIIGAQNLHKPVVFLNVYPLDGYNAPLQTVVLIGNTLQYLSGFYNWIQPVQRSLTLAPGEEASVELVFGATYPMPVGAYTGRLNVYHNDPEAENPLSLPARLTVEPAGTAAIP